MTPQRRASLSCAALTLAWLSLWAALLRAVLVGEPAEFMDGLVRQAEGD